MTEIRTSEGTAALETQPANTRRRVIGKSEPVAITTQEAIDGYREKAWRIASLDQIELGSIMELSISGQLLRGAKRLSIPGGISLCKTDGWNMKNHSHLKVARRLREKIHPTTLAVTIRENEDGGMCSATLRELRRIVKDQLNDQTAVVVAISRNSEIWKGTSMRFDQLKYVDVGRMRVITNSEHVAEQIKSDKSENAAMDGVKFGRVGKIDGNPNLKSTVMDGDRGETESTVKRAVMDGVNFGKLANYKNDDKTLCRSEEKLCKSILKGLVKRNQEKHTMIADVEETQEDERDVVCYDDVTGKELPWCAVRKARELELQYLRDLGVYEKVDEKEALKKYGVTPIDTKWIDTDKAFEGEPMQIRSRICAREFKSDDRPDLYAGTPPLEALKAILSIAANHKEGFSIMHINVSRAYFDAKAQRPVLIRLPAEDRMGSDAGKVGLMKKSMYGTRDAASNWERDWQGHVLKWGFQLGASSKNLFHHEEDRVPGLTHGDDFVFTGPTEKLMKIEKRMKEVYPISAKIISHGSSKSIKTLNRRLHWGERGIMYQHDPRHVDVLVKDLGLEHGNSVQTPAAPNATEEEESEHHRRYKSLVARCLFSVKIELT